MSTIIHENTKTTIVLIAVATFESVSRIPHFAKIDVKPAKIADKNAKSNHITVPLFFVKMFFIYYTTYCSIC